MDKSCHSSGDSTTTTASSSSSSHNNNSRDQYLRHLNKISHKISKPVRRPGLDHRPQNIHQPVPPPPPPPPPQPQPQPQPQQTQSLQQQQQPPVYNINKSDFRDVVQKLTGSPAHERFSTPPPIQPPKPQSSRLQRIRPPPLAQISNRPPPFLNNAVRPLPQLVAAAAAAINSTNPVISTAAVGHSSNFGINPRPVAPLSPLPPFPAVHAAAESPISAYRRYLQSSVSTADSDPKRYSGLSPLAPLVSPRWNSLAQPQPPPPPPPQQQVLPSVTSASMAQNPFLFPSSPLPFGCMPSPNPSLLFSPSATGQLGFQQFPVSPRLPVPSPRWKDL